MMAGLEDATGDMAHLHTWETLTDRSGIADTVQYGMACQLVVAAVQVLVPYTQLQRSSR